MQRNNTERREEGRTDRMTGVFWPTIVGLALALIAAACIPAALAERFTPAITPTSLPLLNGLSQNAMLLTRTSMPPGLTASSPAYTAPAADQLADEFAAWAWIGPTSPYKTTPLAFLVSRVAEISVTNQAWHNTAPFFALRYFNGSVQVYQVTDSGGVIAYNEPYWLPGLYSEMTAGESHMCFLRTDQHVECKAASVDNFPTPSALMASRSAVAYTQIAAASWFTCGLRAVDQLVECFGAVGGKAASSTPMNYTSQWRYSSIAAQFDSGFCGIVIAGGHVVCYAQHLNATSEDVRIHAYGGFYSSYASPIWLYLDGASRQWDQACAMLDSGGWSCADSDDSPAPISWCTAQLTSINLKMMGADCRTGLLQLGDSSLGWTRDPTAAALFEVLRFLAVDAAQGDDDLCRPVSLQNVTVMQGIRFVPCASLDVAIGRISHSNTWIQLLPGNYSASSLTLDIRGATTIASTPPAGITPDELALLGNGSWVARMAQTSGPAVTINCTGAANCFSTSQFNIRFIGLTFTGSTRHAIWSYFEYHAGWPWDSTRLYPSTLTVTNCVFDAVGAVLLKQNGSVTISGCTITNSLPWANATLGLIELEDASLVMTGTTFSNNHLPVAEQSLRSCLRSSSTLPVTLSISDSHWLNNSASSVSPTRLTFGTPGGVAIQILANGPLTLSVVDSTVVQQTVRCSMCNAGAVLVLTGAGAPGNRIQTSFLRVTFDRNSNMPADVLDPTSPKADKGGARETWGGCLSISETKLDSSNLVFTAAAEVVIQDCHFRNSQALSGGCLSLGLIKSLLIERTDFDQCAAHFGGAVFIERPTTSAQFVEQALTLSAVGVANCRAYKGGGLCVALIQTHVQLDHVAFTNMSATEGGAMFISSCGPVFEINNCEFEHVAAAVGGALRLDTQHVQITGGHIRNAQASSRGGAISATNCGLSVTQCIFTDVGLMYQDQALDPAKAVDRLGGAIAAVGGDLVLTECSFTRVSALPNDLQLNTCSDNYDTSAGVSRIGLGGVLSVEYGGVSFFGSDVTDASACSGGVMYARSSSIAVEDGSFLRVDTYSGGFAALDACAPISVTTIVSTHDISAVAAGGAFILNECLQITMNSNSLSDISVTNGDGGLIWISALRRPSFHFTDNIITSITAPRGAGALVFVQSAPNAFSPLDPIDDPSLNNQFINQTLDRPTSLYGPLIATPVTRLAAAHSSLTVYAGSLLSSELLPLRITAFDAYDQAITQDRDLIVQVACPDVELRGTTLRRINATDGSALFSDLRVIAAPGNYTLLFSIVTAPAVSIALNLTVTADCPAASFYSSSERSCINCTSDILVYNATTNTCLGCPAGWHRVANGTGGPLRDGVSCVACPLGQRSSVGGPCTECGPNTYQPIPLGECVTCSTMDGLNCVGDGLARVESGFFAMAIGDRTAQRIHTFRCPETFCSAAQLQVVTNSSSLLSAFAVNSFGQCAFPRLASPFNLLCGECAEGYRPWGNKCSKCDSVDGGLLFGMIVLSLALLGWLIHSSFGSPSAGHSVVVLYFVQTAMLELGSLNNLLAWLNVVLLSPNSVGRCVAPLTPYQQVQSQILMPVVLELELLCIGALHWYAFRLRGGAVAAARELALSPLPAAAPLSSKLRSSVVGFVSLFSVDLYVAASLSLMLFCYTQVGVACMSYLHCVKVGSESVVFSQPSMRCESVEYAETWVLVVLALVGFVVGFPLVIGWFLWFRADRVHGAQAIIADRAREEKARKNGEQSPAAITPAVAPASPSPVAAAVSESPVSASAAAVSADPPVDDDSDSEETEIPAAWGAVRRRRDVIASDGTIVADTSSAAAVAAEARANEQFLRRFAPVFAMYRPSAWFWQAFMLCRRTVFVALSIGLVSTPRARFLSFGIAHVVSLLLQLLSSPFRLAFFNRAEFASHLLLITLSMTLTAYLSPFPAGVDLFMFLLILLPLIAYAAIASRQHVGERRARKAMLEYAQRQGKREEQALQAELTAAADRDHCDVGVEMGELHAHRGSTAVELDPQLQANPAATDGGLLGLSGADPSDSAQL